MVDRDWSTFVYWITLDESCKLYNSHYRNYIHLCDLDLLLYTLRHDFQIHISKYSEMVYRVTVTNVDSKSKIQDLIQILTPCLSFKISQFKTGIRLQASYARKLNYEKALKSVQTNKICKKWKILPKYTHQAR